MGRLSPMLGERLRSRTDLSSHSCTARNLFLPGEMKKTLCRTSFLVTSRISLVMLISLPTVGGTRRKSRILPKESSSVTRSET